jgi:hypothetical protein
MRVAISGHRGLPDDTERLIQPKLHREAQKRAADDLTCVSCIADGPDSWFARAVLDAGGGLIVVVPAEKYRDALPVEHHPVYDELLARASDVIRLDHVESTSQAHMDASVRMLELADELVAVWDGQPARGYGGTADVVDAARDRGLAVTVVWPDGAERDAP